MTKKSGIKKITLTGVLASMVIVLAFIPIKTFGAEITLAIIPLAIGSIVGGIYTGTILGAVFGITSFIQCFGYSPFGTALFAINPILTLILCVIPRILAGMIPCLITDYLMKNVSNISLKAGIISFLTPILNTIFFTSLLVFFFYESDYIQYYVNDVFNSRNVFMFMISFVGINGLVEILFGMLISFPVSKIVLKIFK